MKTWIVMLALALATTQSLRAQESGEPLAQAPAQPLTQPGSEQRPATEAPRAVERPQQADEPLAAPPLRESVSPSQPGEPSGQPTTTAAGRANPVVIDRLDLGTTSITGNQELPKVLYIVPWKRSDLGDLAGRPLNTLLEEVLAPVDPEVFERHLSYYETLQREQQEE